MLTHCKDGITGCSHTFIQVKISLGVLNKNVVGIELD